ncbi:MFS transporter [Anaerotignum sp. MB30-C6]|uniref:MFS transporter n=1 Tax=Anaerotignum sp. MB30-C6 TaxID=3070814 RepID=UPI0027DC15C9|nr:MFS transporter [Anaerotignum sp. MB30-C6]WMI80584.1 MFS transporter [Anaerotignum sp. MB30-C6]
MYITQKSHWKQRTVTFLVSQCITLFGSTLVQMGIVWYATMQTSSGVWVAAFTICAYLPQFLISFMGGVWADRYNRKSLIIGADLVIAAVTLAMVLAIPYISSEPSLLFALLGMSVIRSLGAGIQTPALNAVIPQLVPEEQLMRYNGINMTMQSVVQFAAPAAAGAIFAVGTLRSMLMVDILTATCGIGILSCVLLPKKEMLQARGSIFIDMKEGIKYTFSHKVIGRLLIIYGLFIFLCVPAGFLAGLLVRRVYGDTYWYLTAVELVGFAGMIVGGLAMSTWGGFKNTTKTLLISLTAFGMFAIGMGLSRSFILYLALMLFYGIALTMVQTSTTTLLQEKTDDSMQGRVFGLLGSMYSGFLPIGMAIFGPMADKIPLQWIMVGSGVGLIIIAATMSRHFVGE